MTEYKSDTMSFTALLEQMQGRLDLSNEMIYTVSARIEPHSWFDPHLTKKLIEPQSKTNIETIEPHLELTPTQTS